MDICSEYDKFYFYVMLRHVFEGLFFTENNITIKTDELEEEKREKNASKNEEQQHRRSKQDFIGIWWKLPKVELED